MKKVFYFLVLGFLIASVMNANETFDGAEFKIKMVLPEELKYKTCEKGKWGVFHGKDSQTGTYLAAYAYQGEVTRNEIYQLGIKETGISKNFWQEIAEGQNEKGFAWYKIYAASDRKNTLYACIGRNKNHTISYLFFILAPHDVFEDYETDYTNWIESIEAID